MKVAIVGNDLRSLALAHRVLKDGGTPVMIPGPQTFTARFPICTRPIASEPGLLPWQQMRLTAPIVEAVIADPPDMLVCLHIESSDAGLCDALRATARSRGGWPVFGVDQMCSQLETSKAFGLRFASEAGLTIPETRIIEANMRGEWEKELISASFNPMVLKADGLAGGRGTQMVFDPTELPAALAAIGQGRVVYQEVVQGTEVALSLLCNSGEIELLDINFEYKRAKEGDAGPNTPGMGSISHMPYRTFDATKLLPGLADGLDSLGYRGPLDVSFMIRPDGTPVFLEFTARFGDPELCVQAAMLPGLTRVLWNIARHQTGELGMAAQPWAGCIVARGTPWPVAIAEMKAHIVHRADWNGSTEACYVAGAAYPAFCRRALRDIAESLPGDVAHRRDIGHDVDRRWQSALRWFDTAFKRSGS